MLVAIKFQFSLFDIKSLVPLDIVACVRDDLSDTLNVYYFLHTAQ